MSFKLGSKIPSPGYIKFIIPEKLIFENDNQIPICYELDEDQALDYSFTDSSLQVDCNVVSYSQDPGTYGIQQIKLTNMCFTGSDLETSICPKGKEYIIRVTNIMNAQSIKLIDQTKSILYNSYTP